MTLSDSVNPKSELWGGGVLLIFVVTELGKYLKNDLLN